MKSPVDVFCALLFFALMGLASCSPVWAAIAREQEQPDQPEQPDEWDDWDKLPEEEKAYLRWFFK